MNDPRLEAMGDTPGSDVCGCTRVMWMTFCPICWLPTDACIRAQLRMQLHFTMLA